MRLIHSSTGRLFRWGAAATASGSVALVALVLFTFATGQASTSIPPAPVFLALSLFSFLLWLVGSLVFALGLMRRQGDLAYRWLA